MKKTLVFLLTLVTIMLFTSLVCYASEYDDYINEVNAKYELNLIKNDGVEELVDFETFKNNVDRIANSHVENEAIINYYENQVSSEPTLWNIGLSAPLATDSLKTTTRRKLAGDIFYIKATYDYYTTSPRRVRNFRNISWHWQLVSLFGSFSPNSGYPKVSYLDSSRTGRIVYVGKYTDITISDPNYKFSAEFSAP